MENERKGTVAKSLSLFPEAIGLPWPGLEAGAEELEYIGPSERLSMPLGAICPEPEIERRAAPELPPRVKDYPQLRFMGSKHRLLPWLHEILHQVEFDTALDAFSGSGCVAYLFKSMGKEVTTNDFLNFTSVLASALVENSGAVLRRQDMERLLSEPPEHAGSSRRRSGASSSRRTTCAFSTRSGPICGAPKPHRKALALSALIRSCVKRQPRGVFTVAGDPERYKDGRRDLRLSLRDHFVEQAEVFNRERLRQRKKEPGAPRGCLRDRAGRLRSRLHGSSLCASGGLTIAISSVTTSLKDCPATGRT